MANFAYIKGPTVGAWATGTTPSQADWAQLDTNLFKCPNFADGGVYAPSSPVIVGGAGMVVMNYFTFGGAPGDGEFVCNGDAYFNGNTQIASTSNFEGTALFNADVTVNANETVTGGMLLGAAGTPITFVGTGNFACYKAAYLQSETFCNSTLDVAGAATFAGNVNLGNSSLDALTISATTTVQAPLTFNAASTFATGVHLDAVMTPGTGGYIVKRGSTVSSDAQTSSLADVDVVRVAVTGNHYLANVGNDGAVIRVINGSGGSLNVRATGSGAVLHAMSSNTWVDLMRDAAYPHGWMNIGEGSSTPVVE